MMTNFFLIVATVFGSLLLALGAAAADFADRTRLTIVLLAFSVLWALVGVTTGSLVHLSGVSRL